MEGRTYIAIDLKSFYASAECVERGLSRTEKTICLAVTPSLKAYGIPGRALDYIVAPPRMARYMDRTQGYRPGGYPRLQLVRRPRRARGRGAGGRPGLEAPGSMTGKAVTLTWFRPDARKAGGACVTDSGVVKSVDLCGRTVLLMDGRRIPIADILDWSEVEP